MRLPAFIAANTEPIISGWQQFAKTCLPAANGMTLEERRDHIVAMLQAIAVDLESPQTERQQAAKSKGEDDAHVDSATGANAHGSDRAASGFTPAQMVGEFRALRASVLQLWSATQPILSHDDLEEVTRFNEAIDQLVAESIARYGADVERSRDLFLGVLGHDLRNPLGAIMMGGTLMLTQEGPDWPHANVVARMMNSCRRMDAMIADLADFTRAQLGGGIPITVAEMDMDVICRLAVDEVSALHPRCPVAFEASGNLRGQWDSGRIGQAVSNLVGNAYQHGSADAVIEVSLRGELEHVVLQVHNTGVVIAKEHLKDIFNPFRQLHAASAAAAGNRSMGLGLYIVQAIVAAHHGTIEVESDERGTTFTVRWPRTVAPTPA